MDSSSLTQLLEQLCRELDLPFPQLNQEKRYALVLNPSLSIAIADMNPGISLHAVIAEAPEEKREDLWIYLMRANFLGQGTGGARLGLDADENFLTLSRGFPYEMDYPAFKEGIEDFVNYAAYWREEIQTFGEP